MPETTRRKHAIHSLKTQNVKIHSPQAHMFPILQPQKKQLEIVLGKACISTDHTFPYAICELYLYKATLEGYLRLQM